MGFQANAGIDTEALHRYFWDRRTKPACEVKVNSAELGRYLGVTRFTIYRHMKLLTDAGKLTAMRRTVMSCVIYKVADPALWGTATPPEPEPEAVPKSRVLKWG